MRRGPAAGRSQLAPRQDAQERVGPAVHVVTGRPALGPPGEAHRQAIRTSVTAIAIAHPPSGVDRPSQTSTMRPKAATGLSDTTRNRRRRKTRPRVGIVPIRSGPRSFPTRVPEAPHTPGLEPSYGAHPEPEPIVVAAGGFTDKRWEPESSHAATIYDGPKGNFVFNAGTCWWSMPLARPPGSRNPPDADFSNTDPRVQRMTKNLFDRVVSSQTSRRSSEVMSLNR